MEPRIVEQAGMAPGQCLFSQDQDGPWIDTGVVAPWVRPYGYLSVRYVEDLAKRLLGMRPAAEVEAEIGELREALADYRTRVEQLENFVQAAENYASAKENVNEYSTTVA